MNTHNNTRQGFVQLVILIVIALIILGYLGFNIKEILESPTVQENLQYAWETAKTLWTTYLQGPFMWLWENIVTVLWNIFLEGLQDLQNAS